MRNDVGEKICGVATIVKVFGIGISLLAGFILLIASSAVDRDSNRLVIAGLITAASGSISAYLIGLFMEGFGALVHNSFLLVAASGAGGAAASSAGSGDGYAAEETKLPAAEEEKEIEESAEAETDGSGQSDYSSNDEHGDKAMLIVFGVCALLIVIMIFVAVAM